MKKLEWIEVMRGFAALWVLLHHAHARVAHFVGEIESSLFENGYLGVDFFFVLSGFIIALSCERLLSKGEGFYQYASARLIRIYVPYLPIGIAMLLAYAIAPSMSENDRSVSVFSSLTLLPSNGPTALSVAWTLVHEVIFYSLFSLVFVSRRALFAMLILWSSLILVLAATDIELSRLAEYILSPLNLCFVLGVGVYYATSNGVRRYVGWASVAAGIFLVASQAASSSPSRIVISVGFAALITAAASDMATKVRPKPWMVTLGAASYAIYLVHNPVVSVAARVARRAESSPWVALIAVSAIAFAASLAYHLLYERKAVRAVRGRMIVQPKPTPSE